MSTKTELTAIKNNFDHNRWAQNTYSILGGKPLWIDPFDSTIQHIFIDDNIRQNNDDTIVHPKVSGQTLVTLTKCCMLMELKQLCVILFL